MHRLQALAEGHTTKPATHPPESTHLPAYSTWRHERGQEVSSGARGRLQRPAARTAVAERARARRARWASRVRAHLEDAAVGRVGRCAEVVARSDRRHGWGRWGEGGTGRREGRGDGAMVRGAGAGPTWRSCWLACWAPPPGRQKPRAARAGGRRQQQLKREMRATASPPANAHPLPAFPPSHPSLARLAPTARNIMGLGVGCVPLRARGCQSPRRTPKLTVQPSLALAAAPLRDTRPAGSDLLWASLLFINAIAVLNEERFLARSASLSSFHRCMDAASAG